MPAGPPPPLRASELESFLDLFIEFSLVVKLTNTALSHTARAACLA